MNASRNVRATGKLAHGAKSVTMSHGSGGKDMRDLIHEIFVGTFANSHLSLLEDQARIEMSLLNKLGDRLAFTSDSYVVDPIFFPGGDIGTLAVNGTVNDLAVGAAVPLYLSCSMIIEEGFPIADLQRVASSMKEAADKAGVMIVTGDTKVVEKNACDKLFVNTAGVGVIRADLQVSARQAEPGDLVLINGHIGEHGAAIVSARGDIQLSADISSDCQPLNHLVDYMINSGADLHCLRDATRGGIATVLNEFALNSNVCIKIYESKIPIREDVRAVCEILGLDPLYLANEGKLIAIAPPEDVEKLLHAMKQSPAGECSAIIGEVHAKPESTVILETVFGGQRIVDMLIGEQLPRIC